MYTEEDFIRDATRIHQSKFDYSLINFKNKSTPVVIICPKHGNQSISPYSHLNTSGCKECGKEIRREKIRDRNSKSKLTTSQFIELARKAHDNRYTYERTVYNGYHKHVSITCKEHGDFNQIAFAHIKSGQGCPTCYKHNRLSFPNFVEKASSIHGKGKYDYSRVKLLERVDGKVIIVCPQHGEFLCRPCRHINESTKEGCPECGKAIRAEKLASINRLTTEEFIHRARRVHGTTYDYDNSLYLGTNEPVKITCPIHGDFEQVAGYHLSGNGCQKCSNISKSKMENEWLTRHGVEEQNRQVRLTMNGEVFIVDGFDPYTNTVYEFWGDFWHGNPSLYDSISINARNGKTFGELYENTLRKIDIILESGYNLIDIWETDWITERTKSEEN